MAHLTLAVATVVRGAVALLKTLVKNRDKQLSISEATFECISTGLCHQINVS